jgi:hypothetical protein
MKRLSSFVGALVLGLALTSSAAAEPGKARDLFNGKDLSGWKMAGPGTFEVQDGALVTIGGMGLLWHETELDDYVLTLEFKASRKQDNSGVFVRFPDPGNDPWVAVNEGYEIQICDSAGQNSTGAIYNAKPATELATKPIGEWNTMEVTVAGQSITVKLNGKVVNEYTGDRKTQRGFIGLQNHDDKTKVSFRSVKITPIEKKAE